MRAPLSHPRLPSKPGPGPLVCLDSWHPHPTCVLTAHQCRGTRGNRILALSAAFTVWSKPHQPGTSGEVQTSQTRHYPWHHIYTSFSSNRVSDRLLLSLSHPHISRGQLSPPSSSPPHFGFSFPYNRGNFLFIPAFCRGMESQCDHKGSFHPEGC